MARPDRGRLPHLSIRVTDGMVTEVTIDSQPIRGVKSVTFHADVSSGYPLVSIEMWATVELAGEVSTVVKQERRVVACPRLHADGATEDTENAPEPSSVQHGAIPGGSS